MAGYVAGYITVPTTKARRNYSMFPSYHVTLRHAHSNHTITWTTAMNTSGYFNHSVVDSGDYYIEVLPLDANATYPWCRCHSVSWRRCVTCAVTTYGPVHLTSYSQIHGSSGVWWRVAIAAILLILAVLLISCVFMKKMPASLQTSQNVLLVSYSECEWEMAVFEALAQYAYESLHSTVVDVVDGRCLAELRVSGRRLEEWCLDKAMYVDKILLVSTRDAYDVCDNPQGGSRDGEYTAGEEYVTGKRVFLEMLRVIKSSGKKLEDKVIPCRFDFTPSQCSIPTRVWRRRHCRHYPHVTGLTLPADLATLLKRVLDLGASDRVMLNPRCSLHGRRLLRAIQDAHRHASTNTVSPDMPGERNEDTNMATANADSANSGPTTCVDSPLTLQEISFSGNGNDDENTNSHLFVFSD